MTEYSSTLKEIDQVFRGKLPIPKSKLMEWPESNDRYVFGAIIKILLTAAERVKPRLSQEEFGNLLVKAGLGIIVSGSKDDESDYSYTDYQAAEIIRWWVIECYNQSAMQQEALASIKKTKNMLAAFYQTENDDVRNCIIHGILEHIFEVSELQKFFEDWSNNPTLVNAYESAKTWGNWRIQEIAFLLAVGNYVARMLISQAIDATVREPNIGDHGLTIEWCLPDQVTTQRLRILSFADPSAPLSEIVKDSHRLEMIAKYVLDAKNWQTRYGQRDEFSVAIPTTLVKNQGN